MTHIRMRIILYNYYCYDLQQRKKKETEKVKNEYNGTENSLRPNELNEDYRQGRYIYI